MVSLGPMANCMLFYYRRTIFALAPVSPCALSSGPRKMADTTRIDWFADRMFLVRPQVQMR